LQKAGVELKFAKNIILHRSTHIYRPACIRIIIIPALQIVQSSFSVVHVTPVPEGLMLPTVEAKLSPIHHGHLLLFEGESYRMTRTLIRQTAKTV
jgi:hypothetical protein